MKVFQGAYTALITPMRENGDVDYDGFRELIGFQMREGIDGLVPLGTTGETPTLEEDEEEKLLKIAVEEVKGRIPVIAGAGSNSTKYAVKYVKRARDLGADAALVVTPYYNKPNDEGLLRHFESAAVEGGLPVIIYNIASRTGRNISPALMERLSRIPGIIGVKEASGDLAQIGDIIRDTAGPRKAEGGAFTVLSGDDALTLPLMALGGDGVISVVSNLIPGRIAALVRACQSGDFAEGRRLHYALLPLVKTAFIETNPIPIKAAMTWAGLPGGPARLPLGPLSPENGKRLYRVLEDLGIQKGGLK
ncbi:MAG: 4-hydroxy-tetrahydrodipicolinate synthase [Spirochaetaceae bacterium]|jgi:4-hydroxy-tetrahydrodipicolinate synthase|nr:4-hydroxy-tetrahydrodipicolinate synthase [Spirochaetaceae bacterium]